MPQVDPTANEMCKTEFDSHNPSGTPYGKMKHGLDLIVKNLIRAVSSGHIEALENHLNDAEAPMAALDAYLSALKTAVYAHVEAQKKFLGWCGWSSVALQQVYAGKRVQGRWNRKTCRTSVDSLPDIPSYEDFEYRSPSTSSKPEEAALNVVCEAATLYHPKPLSSSARIAMEKWRLEVA